MWNLAFTAVLIAFSFVASAQKLTIAVAANAQYALRELVTEFKKSHKTEIDLIVGSSGKLTAQIAQGAPFHLFFSADMEYPKKLNEMGLTYKSPQIYAYGTLVLWTAKTIKVSKDLKELNNEKVRKIAIANPDLAPYGLQAVKVLKNKNLYDGLERKLVFGESIAQVNQYITTGSVEAAFTSKSTALSEEMKGSGNWLELDQKLYEPIAQGVVFLKKGKEEANEVAAQFLAFVFSAKGKTILSNNGYKVPDKQI